MEVAHDVIIIGAGPAGSTLAALLASRGASVALVDRDEFPRDKLCGEFVSYDALPILEMLGVSDRLAPGARIRRCRIVTSRSYEFELPSAAVGISRMRFDDLLLRTAIDRGATAYTGWTASRLEATVGARSSATAIQGGVVIERGGMTQHLRGAVIVGAWGRWGRFDTQLGRPFARVRSHRSFGFKRHYRGGSTLRDVIELYSFRGG
ncbi:MAG TPA: FAD-dependent oxidoreductase, partial [Thermoanaerobaculia bacterium]|nr:FAD-dependent oxidoreductase [Thermoanaerobaculia bacterium]